MARRVSHPVPRTSIAVAFVLLLAAALPVRAAAPPRIQGIAMDKGLRFRVSWQPADGAAAYHLYSGSVSELASGSAGVCLEGSVPGTSADIPDNPPAGSAFFYLVSGVNADGEGSLGESSDGTEREPASRCRPARRVFDATPNGDAPDGVADGKVRPTGKIYVFSGQRIAVDVAAGSGEVFAEAVDLRTGGKVSDFGMSRVYRSQVSYDGPLGRGWDFGANARLRVGADGVVFHDGAGGRWEFRRPGGSASYASPPGFYGRLLSNPDGTYSMRVKSGTGVGLDAARGIEKKDIRRGHPGARGNGLVHRDVATRRGIIGREQCDDGNDVWALEKGLSHLHEKPIIHRDLAARALGIAPGGDEDCDDADPRDLDDERIAAVPCCDPDHDDDGFAGIAIDEPGLPRPKGGHGSHRVSDPYADAFTSLAIDEPGVRRTTPKVHSIHRGERLAGRLVADTRWAARSPWGGASDTGAGRYVPTPQRDKDKPFVAPVDDLLREITVLKKDEGGRHTPFHNKRTTAFGRLARPALVDIATFLPDTFDLLSPEGPEGSETVIADFDRDGRLLRVTDETGAFVSYLYDRQKLLTQVVDEMGAVTTFSYDPQGRLQRVTDASGREVWYGYDAAGHLVSVRGPAVTGTPTGNDFPSGKTTTYAYASGTGDAKLDGNLLSVTTGAQSGPTVQLDYGTSGDAFDRALAITEGGTNQSGVPAGGTATFEWSFLNLGSDPDLLDLPRRRCVMTDAAGNRKLVESNARGEVLTLVEETNREVRPGEGNYITLFRYNADGEIVRVDWPGGAATELAYDSSGADPFRRGNLLELRLVADPLRGDGSGSGTPAPDLVWTFRYEPVFNHVYEETGPKGNNPLYEPPNQGLWAPERYTTAYVYDYMEGDFATNGVGALAARWGVPLADAICCLGDTDGDGREEFARGRPVRVTAPAVALDPASRQAAIEGDTSQDVVTLFSYDDTGALVRVRDPEGNAHHLSYNPQADPDGDGVPVDAPPDGRVLDPARGGWLHELIVDAEDGAQRNNGNGTPPRAAVVRWSSNARGLPTSLVDPRGVRHTIVWNALDQVVELRAASATAASGGPHGDPATGRGDATLAPLGDRTRFVYDADDNVTEVHEEDVGGTAGAGPWIVTSFTRDQLGRVVREEQPVGNGRPPLVTERRYDANGNPTQVTLADGSVHTAIWDERDLPETLTLGAGGGGGGSARHAKLVWSPRSNVDLYATPGSGETAFAYDGHDRLVRVRDAAGNTAECRLDPASRCDRLLLRGPVGGPTPTDPSGSSNVDLAEVLILRDELGRPFRIDRRLFVPNGASTIRPPALAEGSLRPGDGAVNTALEYDRNSRPTFAIDDAGYALRTDYDGRGAAWLVAADGAAGSVARELTFDEAGHVTGSLTTEYASVLEIKGRSIPENSVFDALGRPTMVVGPGGATERFVWSSRDRLLAYADANGPPGGTFTRRLNRRAEEQIDINATGNVTRFASDAAGRPVSRTRVLTADGRGDGTWTPTPDASNPANPDGLITDLATWSSSAPQLALTDDNGSVTAFWFDNGGRLTRRENPDGTHLTVERDAAGRPATVVDENGSRFVQEFDVLGRMTRRTIARAAGVEGTTAQNVDYDGLGRVTRVTDNNDPSATNDDSATFLVYDSLSRPVEERYRRQGTPDLATDYRWAASDRLVGLVHPDGRTIEYGYDAAGRNVSLTDGSGGSAALIVAGLDRVLELQWSNGLRSTALDDSGLNPVGYDEAGRIVQWRHLGPGGALLAGYEYRYDGAGRVVSSRQAHRPIGAGAFGRVFRYDSAGRIVQVDETELDAAHVRVGPFTHREDFVVNGRGDRVQFQRGGVSFTATPNNLGQYNEPQGGGTSVDDGLPDDYLDRLGTPPDGWNFAYDKGGNRTTSGPVRIAYDAFGRPVRASRVMDGATLGRYAYDGLDRLVLHTDGAGNERRTSFAILLGDRPVEERDGGNARTKSSVGPVRWAAPESLGKRTFPAGTPPRDELGDGLGSVVTVCDAGNPSLVLERVDYDPFGKPLFSDASGAPLVDATGRFLAASASGLARLRRGALYLPELGERTADRATDWGGCHAAGGACDDPNTDRPIGLNGLPPGEPVIR